MDPRKSTLQFETRSKLSLPDRMFLNSSRWWTAFFMIDVELRRGARSLFIAQTLCDSFLACNLTRKHLQRHSFYHNAVHMFITVDD